MASDLMAVLGFQTLTGTIKVFFDQSKNRFYSTKIFTNKKAVLGDIAKWHQLTASRELAPIVGNNDTAVRQANLGVDERQHSMANILVSKEIYARELFQTGYPTDRQGAGMTLLPNAAARIADEQAELMNQVTATIEWMCARAAEGAIAISPANVPGSRITSTVTYDSVQSLNAGGAYWSTASTKFMSDTANKPNLPNLKKKMREVAGQELGRIIVNYQETAKLQAMVEVQNAIRGSIPGAPVFPSLSLLNTMLNAYNVSVVEYNGVYTKSGTVTRFVTDGQYIALPESNEWYEMHEGYGEIPTGIASGIIGATGSELGLMKLANPGIYSYAVLNPKPPVSIELFVGWRGLPVLTFGKSVITGTVDA